jgi:hypothetical protein
MMQQTNEEKVKSPRIVGEWPMNSKFVNCPKGCRRKGSASGMDKLLSTKGTGLPVPQISQRWTAFSR